MITIKSIIQELGEDHAGAAQRIWELLLIAAVSRSGGKIDSIRTAAELRRADGGIDILIEHPGQPDALGLLRDGRTVYSVKSGKYAGKPKTFRDELDEQKHPDLVRMIRDGCFYVYCVFADTTIDEQTALIACAKEITEQLGVPPRQIGCAFHTHVERALKAYPGVLSDRLPNLSSLFNAEVRKWGKSPLIFDPDVPYQLLHVHRAAFEAIKNHIAARGDKPLMHVCGLSGIGKTRIVYEAVKACKQSDTVLTMAEPTKANAVLSHFINERTAGGLVVIDEVSLDRRDEFRSRLDEASKADPTLAKRLRVITIGPKMRSEGVIAPDIELDEPTEIEDILRVLRSAGKGKLDEPHLRRLAEEARHDIRLALLFLRVEENAEALQSGYRQIRQLLDRVISLFEPEKRGVKDFRSILPYLGVLKKLGVAGSARAQVEWLTKEFDLTITRVDETLDVCGHCGLGERDGVYFEFIPSGLATRLFEDAVWQSIVRRYKSFVDGLPSDEVWTEFSKRLDQCVESVRKQHGEKLEEWHSLRWQSIPVRPFTEKSESAVLARWLRLSPRFALEWSRRTILQAEGEGGEGLNAVRFGVNEPGITRRVWRTVRTLAGFSEHFTIAEEVLFIAACLEALPTENGCGQDWASLFSTVHAHCETPHKERVDRLIQRLESMKAQTFDLLSRGVTAMVQQVSPVEINQDWYYRKPVPSSETYLVAEEYRTRVEAVKRFVAYIEKATPEVRERWLDWFAGAVARFVLMDTIDDLTCLFSGDRLTDYRRRTLRHKLLHEAFVHALQGKVNHAKYRQKLMEWADQIRPTTLQAQLDEKLRLDDHRLPGLYLGADTTYEDRIKVYQTYAPQVIEQPAILDELRPLLESEECKSGGVFGRALGLADNENRLESVMKTHMQGRATHAMLKGYLAELKKRQGDLAPWTLCEMDAAVNTSPRWAAWLTVDLDDTERGFERLMRCAEVDFSESLPSISRLFGLKWGEVLNAERQARVLNLLVPFAGDADERRVSVAMDLLTMWIHEGKPEELSIPLHEPVLRLLEHPASVSNAISTTAWVDLARLAAVSQPERVIGSIAARAFSEPYPQFHFYERAVPVLIGLAPEHGETIMRVFRPLLSKTIMYIALETRSWATLFELLPVALIQEALRSDNQVLRMNMARLIPPPRIDAQGNPVVPPITRWFFETYGDDRIMMSEFSLGSMRSTWMGPDASIDEHEVQQLQKAFADDANPHVRKWARRRMDNLKNARIRYDEHREELDRS